MSMRLRRPARGRRGVFQPLEKNFPIIGKTGANFPTIGKIFSNHWKKPENFFQSLENRRKIFPIVGKLAALLLLLAAPSARAEDTVWMPDPAAVVRYTRTGPWDRTEREVPKAEGDGIIELLRDAEPFPRRYVLESNRHDGGTLSGVARLFYGDGGKWPVIWEANKDAVPDPDRPKPGTSLVIPALAEGAAP